MSGEQEYTWEERQAVEKWENIDPDDPKNWYRAPPPRPAGLCSKVKEALLNCLKDTDCYKKHGHTPRECMDNTRPGTNPQCAKFARSLATCKFDLVDRKRRFRGVRGVNNMTERASEDEI